MKETFFKYYIKYCESIENLIGGFGLFMIFTTVARFLYFAWNNTHLTQLQLMKYSIIEYSVELVIFVMIFTLLYLMEYINKKLGK